MPLAEVIKIDRENEQVTLRLQDTSACEDCETLGCGLPGRNEVKVPVNQQLELKIGDTVVVEETKPALWAAGSLLFVLPLLLFIAGTSIGYYTAGYFDWPKTELIGFFGGILLILISLPFIREAGRRLAADKEAYTVQAIHTAVDSCPDS